MKLGLIVNPIAGIGGKVGLKGSDGAEIQRQALDMGAQPQSNLRAASALKVLQPIRDSFQLLTPAGGMGEDTACQSGFTPVVIGKPLPARTTGQDTRQLAYEMLMNLVDLLLFAGGDGTARDIYSVVREKLPVLGIPAGVKIHSAVFATHPRAAGEIAAAFLRGERIHLRESEVMDLDEETYRTGKVMTTLYGFLKVPYRPHLLQNRKVPSPATESARLEAISADVVESMRPDILYVLGPGTTTHAIARRLGSPKTLVGVDVYSTQGIVALDVSEARLLELIERKPARIVVTPIGGQGFIFGRGNQQISPDVIRRIGRKNIIIVSPSEKLNALQGEPLLVDTGDAEVDQMLTGYLPVIVGYHEKVVYRVAS